MALTRKEGNKQEQSQMGSIASTNIGNSTSPIKESSLMERRALMHKKPIMTKIISQ